MKPLLDAPARGTPMAEPVAARPRSRVLGIDVDVLDTRALMQRAAALVDADSVHLICYVNADCLNHAAGDRAYRAILQRADLVYADGMGVVWASRLMSEPLACRITLGDALPDLCRMAAQRRFRLFLLGGPPGIAEAAAARLMQQAPGVQIVGTHHGYFSDEEEAGVIEAINRAHPDLLLAGLGVPKQEHWLWRHREALRVPVLWGVGALFEYYAGTLPRAPVWMRRAGLEWLFRLLAEPRRLWRRYLIGNAFFLWRALALPLTDALLVMLAWVGAYAIRHHLTSFWGAINPLRPYLVALPLVMALWLAACAGLGLYRRSAAMSQRAEWGQVAGAACLAWLLMIAAGFLLRELSLGRSVVLLTGVMMFGLLTASRMLLRRMERHAAGRNSGLRRSIIVGASALAHRVKREIETWPAGHEVVGFLDDGAAGEARSGVPLMGHVVDLPDVIDAHCLQDIFVASDRLNLPEAMNLLDDVAGLPVTVHVVSRELDHLASRVALRRIGGIPVMDLPSPRRQAWYEAAKRLCDIAASVAGLAITLPWIWVIALIIKMESPGPALFVQRRVGRGGRGFSMYKFRTMKASSLPYDMAPNDLNDPRVTRFGRFLRRWSLDELPQLVNVLRGEMSLVGPRPEMPFLVQRYEPWQRQRLAVKPGLTCLWQVAGRKELPLHRHIEYDLYYTRHRSWRLDLLILLRTIPAIASRRGAF